MPRGDLFPEIGPFETGYMPLSGGHVMYWEQVGATRGQPVLFLADHPVTGGYPVVAYVDDDDVDRCGQLQPGQRLLLTRSRA